MRNFARFNGNAKTAVTKITYLYTSDVKSSQDEITCFRKREVAYTHHFSTLEKILNSFRCSDMN